MFIYSMIQYHCKRRRSSAETPSVIICPLILGTRVTEQVMVITAVSTVGFQFVSLLRSQSQTVRMGHCIVALPLMPTAPKYLISFCNVRGPNYIARDIRSSHVYSRDLLKYPGILGLGDQQRVSFI